MKVLQMNITTSECMEHTYTSSKLFATEEAAMKYLEAKFVGYVEKTTELKEQQPWRDDIPRTFEHTKKQYDRDGDYDYPIERSIEFVWEDVIE